MLIFLPLPPGRQVGSGCGRLSSGIERLNLEGSFPSKGGRETKSKLAGVNRVIQYHFNVTTI